MLNFRTRILGLAAASMIFAGVSYGQFQCGTNFPLATGALANLQTTTALAGAAYSPTQVRQTATNDLVADLFFECGGQTSALSSGSLTVNLNATVTSKGVAGSNETTLIISTIPTSGTPVVTTYTGTVSGSTVTFTNVNFPGGTYSVEVANIRVAPTGIAAGAAVTESVFIGNLAQVLFSAPAISVGFVEPDFGTPSVTLSTASYPICVSSAGQKGGTGPTSNPTATAFSVSISEKFGGAFKPAVPSGITSTGAVASYLCGGAACNLSNGNTGSFPFPATAGGSAGIGGGVGQSTHGTRFTLTFGAIPSGVTLYVPISVSVSGASGPTLIANLTATATGVFTPVTATTGAPTINGSASWAVPASGVAVYEILFADDTIQNLTLTIPGTFTFAANFTTNPQPTATVTEVQAPDAALNPATNDVPNFAATGTPLNLESWSLCQTTLLFPFVTSVTGFETGIALSNTSTDPGNISGGGPTATATPNQGACTLNFYGQTNGVTASYTGIAAPAPGGASTPYVQPTGTSNAFGIVVDNLVPANFSGYLIAQCNYLYGHGFAFISYLLGTPNGSVEGYLPLIINARPTTGTQEEVLEN